MASKEQERSNMDMETDTDKSSLREQELNDAGGEKCLNARSFSVSPIGRNLF